MAVTPSGKDRNLSEEGKKKKKTIVIIPDKIGGQVLCVSS